MPAPGVMKIGDRRRLIADYLAKPGRTTCSTLDEEFVKHYLTQTKTARSVRTGRIETLNADLRDMHALGILNREACDRVAIPKPSKACWTYVYWLADERSRNA